MPEPFLSATRPRSAGHADTNEARAGVAGFCLRPGKRVDGSALATIEAAAFATDRLSRRSFRNLLAARSASVIVAEGNGGRLLGYAAVLFRARASVARLYSLAVLPDASGLGVGRALLLSAEEAATARGAAALRLEVRENNARALQLYEGRRFRPIGRIDSYYADGAPALRLEKLLRHPS